MAQNGTVYSEEGRNRKSSSRKRSRAWFFTKDNATEDMVAQFIDYFLCEELEYIFQLEKAESGMIHFQGVVRYKNPRDNWPNIGCHWERCRNWRSAIKYCSKLDTRIAGPWTNIPGLKFRKTIIDPLKGKELYSWQKMLKIVLLGEPDERNIYWYWSKKGNMGKTSFCKHMCLNYNAVLTGGCKKDALFSIANILEEKDIDIVFFNISRSEYNGISYAAIESIKDGIFYCGKYESKMCIFNVPHVVVFANSPPEIDKLSKDRWEICELK